MRRTPMVVALCLSLLGPAAAFAQSPSPVTSVSSLGAARADVLAGGRVIVSMDASGDLPGMVTLSLNVGAGGAITGGSWALVISGRQFPEAAAEQVATLVGSIAQGGAVRVDADGRVAAVIGAQLVIDNATPNLPGVQGGYGRADAADLHDIRASYGSLSLTF